MDDDRVDDICEVCGGPVEEGMFMFAQDAIHLTLCLECYRAMGEPVDV